MACPYVMVKDVKLVSLMLQSYLCPDVKIKKEPVMVML
jgi:hypothetical protein